MLGGLPAGTEELDYTTFCRKVMDRNEMADPFACVLSLFGAGWLALPP